MACGQVTTSTSRDWDTMIGTHIDTHSSVKRWRLELSMTLHEPVLQFLFYILPMINFRMVVHTTDSMMGQLQDSLQFKLLLKTFRKDLNYIIFNYHSSLAQVKLL